MATQFTITKIDYSNAPAGSQTWTFEYKLFSASTWALISNTAVVNTSGTLVIPLTITGLTPGTVYNIRATSNCSSPAFQFTTNIST